MHRHAAPLRPTVEVVLGATQVLGDLLGSYLQFSLEILVLGLAQSRLKPNNSRHHLTLGSATCPEG